MIAERVQEISLNSTLKRTYPQASSYNGFPRISVNTLIFLKQKDIYMIKQ